MRATYRASQRRFAFRASSAETSAAAASLGSPLLTAFILCFAVAAIGSSIGTLGIVLPLAAPMLAGGELGVIGFVAALAFCTVIVDVSPFSSNGVMVLASVQVDDRKPSSAGSCASAV
ncbi:hypothetical protein GCM10023215_44890 [Pseudonocardia yuanmonensis]|uniref:Tripartite ATP-independent transporter DctM subunit n=1 Tax=Pseudonocardia yuanmonensis TaxID=1095914 RepID=A0ABP8X7F7_9PSEU